MSDLSAEIHFFMRSLELIAAFAGAISGVRLASVKRFDWFGANVIGFITAAGGGTLRDILLRVEPFWMTDPSYLLVTAPWSPAGCSAGVSSAGRSRGSPSTLSRFHFS